MGLGPGLELGLSQGLESRDRGKAETGAVDGVWIGVGAPIWVNSRFGAGVAVGAGAELEAGAEAGVWTGSRPRSGSEAAAVAYAGGECGSCVGTGSGASAGVGVGVGL